MDGEGFRVNRVKTEQRAGTLFTCFGLACDETWVQCAMHKEQCAMCAVQTLPLMLDAKLF